MFNSEAMISTGCRSRSGGKTLQTCREWRFERRSAGGWCPVAPGVLWLVDFVGTVLFTGGILLFVLLKKIQLYRIPSTLITKHPVLLSSKSQTIWLCLKTGHPKIWWFINVYHGSSMCIKVYQKVSIFKRLFEGNPILREIHLTSSNNCWGALPQNLCWFMVLRIIPLYRSIYWGLKASIMGIPSNQYNEIHVGFWQTRIIISCWSYIPVYPHLITIDGSL